MWRIYNFQKTWLYNNMAPSCTGPFYYFKTHTASSWSFDYWRFKRIYNRHVETTQKSPTKVYNNESCFVFILKGVEMEVVDTNS